MSVLRKLRTRLDRLGIRPSIRLGQNFLLDRNQLAFIVETANPGPDDVILEVGPGSGFLTRRLASTGALVFAVEIDRRLLSLALGETRGLPNVIYHLGDILSGKNALNPEAMDRLSELLEVKRGQPGMNGAGMPALKSVSNLPYSAGTAFIMNMLSSPLPWKTGVFLLQKEVAGRLCAGPGGKEYGAVSIGAALAAGSAGIERIVPPEAFWPRPNVESAVLKMEFLAPEIRSALPWRGVRRIASAVFGARRKILKNALKGVFRNRDAADVLDEAALDPECRGETLTPREFGKLGEMWERNECRPALTASPF